MTKMCRIIGCRHIYCILIEIRHFCVKNSMLSKGGTCDSTFVKEKVKGKIEEEKRKKEKRKKS